MRSPRLLRKGFVKGVQRRPERNCARDRPGRVDCRLLTCSERRTGRIARYTATAERSHCHRTTGPGSRNPSKDRRQQT
eukprot:scaffold6186_cov21-Prasinocladus_malaysianus.AAC.3